MIVEKLKYLKQNGHIHFFQKNGSNFLYSRENNHTYHVDNDVYECIATKFKSAYHALKIVDKLFLHIKGDMKPRVDFYTLFVLSSVNIVKFGQRIKKRSYKYFQTEINFNEIYDSYAIESFSEISAQLNGIDENDLIFVREKDIAYFDENEKHFLNNIPNVKLVYNISAQSESIFSNMSQIDGQFKFEYSSKHESDIYKLINDENYYIDLYNNNYGETRQFTNFLMKLLQSEDEIKKNVYIIYAISKFITSPMRFRTEIETYNGNVFSSGKNPTCDKCWAKNICWTTKSFKTFNVNVFESKMHLEECQAIRDVIEKIILNLHKIEKNSRLGKSEIFDFEGLEIKSIN